MWAYLKLCLLWVLLPSHPNPNPKARHNESLKEVFISAGEIARGLGESREQRAGGEDRKNKGQRHLYSLKVRCGECGVRDWQVRLEVDKCLRALVEQGLRLEPEGH